MPVALNDGHQKPVVLQKILMPVSHLKSTKLDFSGVGTKHLNFLLSSIGVSLIHSHS